MASPAWGMADWLAWMEAHHPSPIELGLERIARVAARLGLRHDMPSDMPSDKAASAQDARIVTVGGTNGKGSCVALLEAMLLADGWRVGAYTSPHLLHYNERVRVDGQAVADEALCSAFETVHAALEEESLTYFEFGTLAAFVLFAQQPLDVWILEVGLGGRLDAVNLLDADVAVITTIDLDHQAWLGDSREAIGREKAGILRAGRPGICADPAPPATLAAHAKAIGAHWLPAGRGWGWRTEGDHWDWWAPELPGAPALARLPMPVLPLPSAAAALAALYALGLPRPPSARAIGAALTGAALPGRYQQVRRGAVEVVLDVGHNPLAARWLAARLAAAPQRTHAVFAIMADKDLAEVIAPLHSLVAHWYVGDLADNPRAAPAAVVAAHLRSRGAAVTESQSLVAAWRAASDAARPGERILIFGSFFTVAAVQSALE